MTAFVARAHDLPENQLPLNQQALHWLKQARETPDLGLLYLTQLAFWGLENGIVLRAHKVDPYVLEEQVGYLLKFGPEPQANVYRWLLTNPNGPETEEQESTLLIELEDADGPLEAACRVLETISSRVAAARSC
jgi:hypothetical protein